MTEEEREEEREALKDLKFGERYGVWVNRFYRDPEFQKMNLKVQYMSLEIDYAEIERRFVALLLKNGIDPHVKGETND